MKNLSASYSRQQGSQEEQIIYDYLLKNVRRDTPGQLIEDFRRLFVEARGFRHPQLYVALEKIVKRKNIEHQLLSYSDQPLADGCSVSCCDP